MRLTVCREVRSGCFLTSRCVAVYRGVLSPCSHAPRRALRCNPFCAPGCARDVHRDVHSDVFGGKHAL